MANNNILMEWMRKKIVFPVKNQLINKTCRKFILVYITLMFVILLFLCLYSDRAFEYETDAPDTSVEYVLQSEENIVQKLDISSGKLSGVSVQFATHQKVSKGEVVVKLNENGVTIRESSVKMEYLVDNAYQKFYFNTPVKLKNYCQYTVSIKKSHTEEETDISVWLSNGGEDLSSVNDLIYDRTLCHQLILVNQKLKNNFLFLEIIFFAAIGFYLLLKIDFTYFKIGKAILTTFVMAAVIETIAISLLPKIVTNVAIVPYMESDKTHVLKPEEIGDVTFDVKQRGATSFEFFVEGEQTDDISLRLVNEDTGEEYLNRKINDNEIIKNRQTGKPAIKISCTSVEKNLSEFPVAKYHMYIVNESSMNIPVSVIENLDGIQTINISLIKDTWLGHKIALLIINLLVFYVIVICIYSKEKKFTVERFFLISVIPLSIVYFILMLPWSAPDTRSHFLATYRLSNMMLGKEEWVGREADVEFYHDFWKEGKNPDMQDIASVVYNATLKAENNELVMWPVPEERMEYYSLFCYLPQVLGLSLGRMLGLGSVMAIYLARLFMVVTYICCCYNAIKKTPTGKFIFAAIPLLPISLMMSNAFSYDPMVMLVTLNFLSSLLLLYKNPESKSALIECMVWTFLTGSVKGGGYLILLPLVLIFIGRKQSSKIIGKIVVSGLLSITLFNILLPMGSSFFQLGEDATGNLSAFYGFSNPVKYINMWIETYTLLIDNLTINIGGRFLAQLEDTIPTVIITGMILCTVLFSMYEKDDVCFGKKDKIIFEVVVFIGFFFTPVMLLSFTPVGFEYIAGVQGRYNLPMLAIILILFAKFRLHESVKNCTAENYLCIKNNCFRIFAVLSCVSVYYMLRLYLRR